MTNEQLKAFLAVAEQGSFRKAAKVIYKTQAAVSSSIKTLEKEFNISLFSREEYRPRLTEEGQAFFQNAKLTMDHFERLGMMGHQLAKGIEPKFNIVISAVVPLPPLLQKVKTIIQNFPHTHINVSTEVLHGVVEPIDSDESDLAFGPDFGLNAHHEKIQISNVIFINVASPHYFNVGAEETISLEESRQYSQIIVRDSAKHSDKASIHVTANKTESWSVNDFATKKELIIAGLGWGRMPIHLIKDELKLKQLVPIHVEGIPTESSGPIYMFRHRNRRKGPVAIQFWDELCEAYSASA